MDGDYGFRSIRPRGGVVVSPLVIVPGLGLGDPGRIPLRELYAPFESIGNNCEFGIVQREAGYDPPGLFRNVGFLGTEPIVNAIAERLDAMFDEGTYDFELPPDWPDWKLNCKRYGFGFHTPIPASVKQDDPRFAAEAARCVAAFRILKRKFLEDLASGTKTFVFRFYEPVPDATIARLLSAVRAHGPGWLLYVREDPGRPAGEVVDRGGGLLRASVPKLSNVNPPRVDFAAWERIARDSLRLRHAIMIGPALAGPDLAEQAADSPRVGMGGAAAQRAAAGTPGGPDLAAWAAAAAVPPPGVPSPRGVAAPLRHEVGLYADDPRTVHIVEIDDVVPDREYVLRSWVFLPSGFKGRSVSLAFMGVASSRWNEADLDRRDVWQVLSVTARMPPDATRMVPTLFADADPGAVFYTAGWHISCV